MRNFRAQSAMEYLMTYGWAILIIAVVLGALFALGVFNSGNFLNNACIGQAGYLCQQPTLQTDGNFSFTLGQSNGYNEYNVELACTATQSVNGGPSNTSAYNCGVGGRPCSFRNIGWGAISTNATLAAGVETRVTGLQCFNTAGYPDTSLSIGQTYTGTLWINYSLTAGGAPNIVAPVATVAIKAS